ncbi:NAD(P)-dependent oxidoreductase [Kineococcus sp. SYSU DK004]|uniref:NAD(P)-dependent oxidoreductase n=1 Tax=Kineococcus sp. SYSU DK004 TaxID=3383125 RepID=UPI003D7DE2E9
MDVALLGLGAMGSPMADVLHAAGARLTVWNRSPQRSNRFRGAGVTVAGDPAGAARPVVLTVLPDVDDVRAVLSGPAGLLAGWRTTGVARPLLIVMGTVSPVAVRELADEVATDGVRVVDAPVSGGVQGAAEARLSIMVGGDEADVAEVAPVLDALGAVVLHLGPLGSGQLAKACNQVVVAATVAAVAEALWLARSSGLDVTVVRELLQGGLADSEVLRQKGHHWVEEDWTPGGTSRYQVKDLGFVQEVARAAGIEVPVTDRVLELFARAVEDGDGDLDHTAVQLVIRRMRGSLE